MMTKQVVVLCLVLLVGRWVESSQDVIKTLTINFTKALDLCKTEMDLPDSIDTDFLNLWRAGYELASPQTGCAVLCLASKLHLVDRDGSLHHSNTQEYAVRLGADDLTAKQIADLLQQCETAAPATDDACLKILGVLKCFKAEIHKLDWAPDIELVMRDVLDKV